MDGFARLQKKTLNDLLKNNYAKTKKAVRISLDSIP